MSMDAHSSNFCGPVVSTSTVVDCSLLRSAKALDDAQQQDQTFTLPRRAQKWQQQGGSSSARRQTPDDIGGGAVHARRRTGSRKNDSHLTRATRVGLLASRTGKSSPREETTALTRRELHHVILDGRAPSGYFRRLG